MWDWLRKLFGLKRKPRHYVLHAEPGRFGVKHGELQ